MKIIAAILTAPADENPPLRLSLGNQTLDLLNAASSQTQDERAAWEPVIRAPNSTNDSFRTGSVRRRERSSPWGE
ncbi:hypothetical protein ACWEPN_33895 [Nonomuraea wenchangensis]